MMRKEKTKAYFRGLLIMAIGACLFLFSGHAVAAESNVVSAADSCGLDNNNLLPWLGTHCSGESVDSSYDEQSAGSMTSEGLLTVSFRCPPAATTGCDVKSVSIDSGVFEQYDVTGKKAFSLAAGESAAITVKPDFSALKILNPEAVAPVLQNASVGILMSSRALGSSDSYSSGGISVKISLTVEDIEQAIKCAADTTCGQEQASPAALALKIKSVRIKKKLLKVQGSCTTSSTDSFKVKLKYVPGKIKRNGKRVRSGSKMTKSASCKNGKFTKKIKVKNRRGGYVQASYAGSTGISKAASAKKKVK